MLALYRRYRFELALLATVAIWGANVPFLKIALREVSTAQTNAIRYTFGTLALAFVAVHELRRDGRSFGGVLRRYGLGLAGLGFVGYFLYQEGFIYGIAHTSSASAALLMATSPLWTALLTHTLGLQRIQAAGWAGLLVALAGTAVVATAKDSSGTDTAFGNGVLILASVAWSVYTALSGRLKGHVSPGTGAFVGMLVALPCLYAVAAVQPGWHPLGEISGVTWATLFFSGSLSVGLTFAVWNAATAHVGPATTAAFSYLTPLITAVTAYFLIDEPITGVHVLGGLLLLGGLFWMRRGLQTPDDVGVEAEAAA